MPTGATDLGFDVVANQPQTELNYRVFVDTSGTEASLASINAIQQAGGGGRLAFSTDAADGPPAQRMLIDNQGNVGIGTDEPNARLDVAGDAKFNGPLNVQGPLTASGLEVSGVGEIGGNLSVTGKLTAASFAGNGAGLSNVTPADSSITSAKLAVDSASFSKVTGGKMVISGDNVGIGTTNPGARLDVAGDAKFNGPLNIQGALTVNGVAEIGGNLNVTGKLTATSFAGNGAGLSNVTPADSSITNAKLAEDAASLNKVSGGKMVISGDGDVQIHGRLVSTGKAIAIRGKATGDNSVGVFGDGDNNGVQAEGGAVGVVAKGKSWYGVVGISESTTGGFGVYGTNTAGGTGVVGESKTWMGVYGRSESTTGGAGVMGEAAGTGVIGTSKTWMGVYGKSESTTGGAGVMGEAVGSGAGVYGKGARAAGFFEGNVEITGRLTARGKAFKIDHPLDPANKYLYHSSVESPDVMNIYNGNIITDTEGNATVVLPDYFEALNGDFRYQLTVIGKLAQAAVASEIENNRFTVKTNQPNVKVSWQVTGIRQDASVKAHRLPVEEDKSEAERGLFLYPEDYGQPKTKGIALVCLS